MPVGDNILVPADCQALGEPRRKVANGSKLFFLDSKVSGIRNLPDVTNLGVGDGTDGHDQANKKEQADMCHWRSTFRQSEIHFSGFPFNCRKPLFSIQNSAGLIYGIDKE